MRKLLIIVLFLSALGVNAQQNSPREAMSEGDQQKKIILVPFDPVLYYSEIDKEIAQKENLKFEEIRNRFRWELDFKTGIYLKTKFKVLALYREREQEIKKDFDYLMTSISFKYELLKKQEDKKKNRSVQSVLKNGQLTEVDNSGEKYMAVVIKNKEVIDYFQKKYNAQYFLFVSQLEIKNDFSNQQLNAMGSYPKKVRVHYNLMNTSGEIVLGAIAEEVVILDSFEIKSIVEKAFEPIAKSITEQTDQIIHPITNK